MVSLRQLWHLTRLFVAALALAAPGTGMAQSQAIDLDIPAQPLEASLRTIAEAQKLQMIYVRSDLAGIQAPAVKGRFTAPEAINKLTEGTGLVASFNGKDTVVVKPKADKGGQAANPTVVAQVQSTERRGADPLSSPIRQEGIVVTAQKRVELLTDVPQAVTVLGGEDLKKQGATQFREFADMIPGLSYHTQGPAINQITLRGVSVGSDISSTVGLYVDEVPYGSSTSFTKAGIITLDAGLFDLDRIEVLKGPQGTLYGASSLGGLLKYVTKQPDPNRFGGEVQMGISDTSGGGLNHKLAGVVNVPINERTAVRMSAFETHDDGYIDNVLLGKKNVNRSDIYGGRVDLLLMPTNRLNIRINGFAQDIKADGFPLADYTRAGNPVDGPLDQRRNFPESFELNFRLASGTVNWDLDQAALTSVSSYQTSKSDLRADATGILGGTARTLISPSVTSVLFIDHQSTDKFVQEARLASKGDGPLEWVLGGFYTHEKSENHQDFIPHTASGPVLPNTFFVFFVPSTYKEYSGFGDVTWHFSREFDVTGGIRYAKNNQTFEQVGAGALGRSAAPTDFSGDSTTYLANARYHLNENATAYLRYATGYRPGGPNFVVLNATTGQPLGQPTFDPDKLKSYEGGFKALTADGRFGVDLSAYYIVWSNIQVNITVGGLAARTNASGDATVRGGEATLSARPTSGLTASVSLGYQDAKFSQAVAALGAAQGEHLADVPKFTGSLNVDYRLPMGDMKPTIGATLFHQDKAKNGYGSTAYVLPEFTRLDLRLGLTLDHGLALQAFVRNVTNEHAQFAPRLVLYPVATGPVQSSIIQPRTFGLFASKTF